MAYDYDLDTFDDDEEPSGGRNTRLLLVLGGVVGLVVVVAVIALVAVLLTRRNRSPSEGEIVVDVPTTEATEAPTFTPFPSEAPSATQAVVEAVTPETGGGGEATISPTPAPTRVAGSITNGSMSEIEGLVQLQIPNTDTWIDVADDVSFTAGASILTGESSSVKLTLVDGSVVRLASQTQVTVAEMSGDATNSTVVLELSFGQAWHAVPDSDFGAGGGYQIVLPDGGLVRVVGPATAARIGPNARARQVRDAHDQGTYFSTTYNSNGSVADVVCLQAAGHCELSNQQATTEMNSGDECQIFGGGNHFCTDASESTIQSFTQFLPEVQTLTPTATLTSTPTLTFTPSKTPLPTSTPTKTTTPSLTPTSTNTTAPTSTANSTATAAAAATQTATVSGSASTATPTPTKTNTPTPTNSPDMEASKTNDVANSITNPTVSWKWQTTVSNTGHANATFANGQTIFTDTMPTSNISYGAVSIGATTGTITGTISCTNTVSNIIECKASGGSVTINTSASFRVDVTATVTVFGTFTNPTSGSCKVDPNSSVSEEDETNNACSNSVTFVAPEMAVSGLGVTIADGDSTPSTTDDTDFGSGSNTTYSNANTFTINNTGTTTLNLSGTPRVTLSDTTNYTLTTDAPTTIAAGGSATFTITFDPTGVATYAATVSIANDDPNENPYNFSITGTGT